MVEIKIGTKTLAKGAISPEIAKRILNNLSYVVQNKYAYLYNIKK